MTENTDAEPKTGAILSSRYRLDRLIDDSSLATVWRGHDQILDRTVVVKVLHSGVGGAALATKFQKQAISAARLSHPNIVPTFDAGIDDGGTAYVVSGYVEGMRLAEVLDGGPLALEAGLSVGVQIADALQHAHSNAMLHRDIQPARIIVVDEEFRVMLADFGVATAIAEATDETLSIADDAGDATHMSPEQSHADPVDQRADIYATGMLIHTVSCGQQHELSVCKTLPSSIVAILEKACAPSASDRYQEAADLKADLTQYLSAINKTSDHRTVRRVLLPPPVAPRTKQPAAEDEGLRTEAVAVSEATAGKWSSGEPTIQHQAVQNSGGHTSAAATPAPSMAPDPIRDVQEGHRKSSRKRRTATAVFVLICVLAAVILGRLVGGLAKTEPSTPGATTVVAPPPPTTAQSFDPLGDGKENEGQAGLAVDGNTATSWSTERYNTRRFGNLKPGVGLVLTQPTAAVLKNLVVESAGTGWSAQIFVADGVKPDLAAWGQPVDTQSGLGNNANFDLHSTRGSTVLIWITDLGTTNRISVVEARIES